MKRLVSGLFILVAMAVSVLRPPLAAALESQAVSSPRAVATLVTDTDALHPGTAFRVALRLRLADGWHTYWKNPGDAGVAPELTLEVPEGTTQSPIDWPAPRRVQEGPVMTYAYTGEVLLPVTLTVPSDAPTTIRAHAQWLVCKEICVPEGGDFSLTLPLDGPAASSQAPLFVAHDRAVPRTSPWAAHIALDGTLFVQGPELKPATVTDAWFIPDQPNRIQDDAAQPLSVRDGGFTLALKPAAGFDASKPLGGVLSVRDRTGLEADVAVDAAPGASPPPAMPPLPQVLVFAFIGGLILNLMPCVFPILAMKAVALVRNAGQGRAHVVAYTAGVLATFVGLAGALLAARATGTAAGWGFQFASPVFVAAMTWLLLAVGLNLAGVFQVGTTGVLANAGSGAASRHGATGSFFTGLLAVLVATPCTAPFMAVAVAAGLAAPPAVTVLVFAVMGLGLASPYVALAELPGLVRMMPRPGRWMEVMKQALAFPMFSAAAWLLWVVSQEAGSVGVLVTAAGAVLVGFAAWILGVGQGGLSQTGSGYEASSQPDSGRRIALQAARGRRGQRFAQVAAAVAVLGAGAALTGIEAAGAPGAAVEAAATAEAFTPEKLAALRAEGRPVFVNMTAAWCVTCLLNERVAISTVPVQRAFAAADVAYLKGDWTRQDPAITAFLQQNGRDGVPLYVFYPAHGAQPEVLPQILTESEVLRRLRTS
jgi:thiol:disulfide interchange protein/DsbC/DsbD-like thiol-disulfide interchange protein